MVGLLALAADGARWTFDGPSAEGWNPTHSLAAFSVSDGSLETSITGGDPYTIGPATAFDAAAFPYVEVRMRAPAGGCQVFFSSSKSPGITAANAVSFSSPGDGAFHRHFVYMGQNGNWAGTIDRLRLDFPDGPGATVEIDGIAAIDLPPRPEWFFRGAGDAEGWSSNPNLKPPVVSNGILETETLAGGASDPWLNAPSVELDAARDRFFSVRMAVDGGIAQDSAQVYFVTRDSPAWGEDKVVPIPIVTDAAFHVYTADLAVSSSWRGQVTAIRFDPVATNAPAKIRIDAIAFDHRWEFEDADPGGWTAENGLEKASVSIDGRLETRVNGRDPHVGAPIAVDAALFPDLEVEMAVGQASTCAASVYFATDASAMSEATRVDFAPVCDGLRHRYLVRLDANPLWGGTATRIRIDPAPVTAFQGPIDVSFDAVRLRARSASVEVPRFAPRRELSFRGEETQLLLRLRSAGTVDPGAITASLTVPAGLTPLDGAVRLLPGLAPGETRDVTFRLRGDAAGAHDVAATVVTPRETRAARRTVRIAEPPPSPGSIPAGASASAAADGSWAVIKSSRVALVLARDGIAPGLGYGILLAASGGTYEDAAAMEPLGRVIEEPGGARAEWDWRPGAAAVSSPGPEVASLVLSGAHGAASYSIELSLGRDDPDIAARWRLSSTQAVSLRALRGPWLRPGERSGEPMDRAVLPGLEWLVRGETSSSMLDVHGPESIRLVPHPLKVAVPAISASAGGMQAALLWDPLAEWTSARTLPSAVFDVPNRTEDRESSLLGLFVPSVPGEIAENALEASQPFTVPARQELSIACRLLAARSADASLPARRWLEAYAPPPPAAPRSDIDEIRLSLDGYGKTLWRSSARGWSHALQFNDPHPFPCMIANVLHGVALDPSGPDAALFRDQAGQALAAALAPGAFGPSGLLTEAGCHLLEWELPFVAGHLDEGAQALRGRLDALRASQAADGSWAFGGDPSLGEPGSVELGTCARNAWVLLKGARITGNAAAAAAGLKALERMKSIEVPRAAQTWEVPVHTPDILAAAHATCAYVEGFRWTARGDLLDEAVRRADEGLIFVYSWGAPGVEVMRGATIPVFGATFYVGSWLGRPVQWCGLVHAYALLDLATAVEATDAASASFFREAALAIERSAQRQQYASGPSRGLLPDSWILLQDAASPADINPSSILHVLWMLEGRGLEVTTAVLEAAGKPALRVSSVRPLSGAARDADGPVRLTVSLRSGEAGYLLVAGLGASPESVQVDAAPLGSFADVDDAPAAASGWSWRAGVGLTLKLAAGSARDVRVAIQEALERFRRGDANGDGSIDISDPVFTVLHLFAGGRAPPCLDAADADDSGAVDVADAVAVLNYIFRSGPAPAAPHPACGVDPTPDGLTCGEGTRGCP